MFFIFGFKAAGIEPGPLEWQASILATTHWPSELLYRVGLVSDYCIKADGDFSY